MSELSPIRRKNFDSMSAERVLAVSRYMVNKTGMKQARFDMTSHGSEWNVRCVTGLVLHENVFLERATPRGIEQFAVTEYAPLLNVFKAPQIEQRQLPVTAVEREMVLEILDEIIVGDLIPSPEQDTTTPE